MLVDASVVAGYALPALFIVIAVIILKFFSGFLPPLIWGYPLRIATLVGVGIAQVGEFSLSSLTVAATPV